MANTDKQLAELLAEERKLLERSVVAWIIPKDALSLGFSTLGIV